MKNKAEEINKQITQERIKEEARIEEKETQDQNTINTYLQQLKICNHSYERDKVFKSIGFSLEKKFIKNPSVRQILFEQLINEVTISDKTNYRDIYHNIVGLSFSIFETSFNSLAERLNLKNDEQLLIKACREVLKRAEAKQDLNLIIPLKHRLYIENGRTNEEEINQFLHYMKNNSNSGNLINEIYFHECLMKWVTNKHQEEDIKGIIRQMLDRGIKEDIQQIENIQNNINQIDEDLQNFQFHSKTKIKKVIKENNNKIKEHQEEIKEQEELIKPIIQEMGKAQERADKAGYNTLSWEARDRLREMDVSIADEEIKDKDKLKEIIQAMKEVKGFSIGAKPYKENIRNQKDIIIGLDQNTINIKHSLESDERILNKAQDQEKRNLKNTSWSILESLTKQREHNQKTKLKIDYYKYLGLVVKTAKNEDQINTIKEILNIIKEEK